MQLDMTAALLIGAFTLGCQQSESTQGDPLWVHRLEDVVEVAMVVVQESVLLALVQGRMHSQERGEWDQAINGFRRSMCHAFDPRPLDEIYPRADVSRAVGARCDGFDILVTFDSPTKQRASRRRALEVVGRLSGSGLGADYMSLADEVLGYVALDAPLEAERRSVPVPTGYILDGSRLAGDGDRAFVAARLYMGLAPAEIRVMRLKPRRDIAAP